MKQITIILLFISIAAFGQAPVTAKAEKPLKTIMSGNSNDPGVHNQVVPDDTTRVSVTKQQLEHMVAVINERNSAKVEHERRELEYQRAMLFILGVPVEQAQGLILDEKKGEFKFIKKPKQ